MTTAQYLVFDVGGTTIKYGLLDDTLQLQATGQCPTLPNEAGHILKELLRLSLAFQADYPLQGIGVSTAGIVGVDGAIQYAGPTIPGYQGTPIQAKLEAATGLPVFVVNDVAAALLGEQLAGGAKNASSVYCVAWVRVSAVLIWITASYCLGRMAPPIPWAICFMTRLLRPITSNGRPP